MHALKFYDKFSVFLNVLLSGVGLVTRLRYPVGKQSAPSTAGFSYGEFLPYLLTEQFILNKSCLSAFTLFLPTTTFFLPLQRSGRSTPVSWPSWRSWAVGSLVWCGLGNGGRNTKWPSKPSRRGPCTRRTSSRRPRSWCKEGRKYEKGEKNQRRCEKKEISERQQ